MPEAKEVQLKIDLSSWNIWQALGKDQSETVSKEQDEQLLRLVAEVQPLLKPRGVYQVFPISEKTDDLLHLCDGFAFHGPIKEFFGPAKRVALFVVTVGERVEALASDKRAAGQSALSHALHAVGSAATEAACDAMTEYIWTHEAGPDEALTPPLSPGYCGMPLPEQETLVAAVDAGRIGVSLLSSRILKPLKSASALVGIGSARAIADHGVPCEHCQVENCQMRRVTTTTN